ncbi:xylosyl- and glucuronyltransferase LARGE2s-like [Amphiura filiformis]|uniref:xylosyl- and glucuronyltransferase LARGE2s-like n=1 Tax=Amphiura filiformis TaxID=82378 RepID=UPI003B20EDC3
MSHSKWNVSVECTDPNSQEECSQIFTTDCRKQMTTAIYQFLPVKATSRIVGIDFTAKGSAMASFKWNDDSKKMDAAVVSSQALLKYTDESYEIVRLHYPTGNYSVMSVGMSKMFPADKTLKSITAMLTCYGFDGSALFRDTTIKPIFESTVALAVQKDRQKCISKCPHYFKPDQDHLPFDVDKERAVTDFQVKHSNLTMVTHLSIDRIDILQKSIAVWTGLISVSVFVPVMDAKKKNQTEPVLTRSRRFLKDKLKEVKFKCKCDLLIIYARNPEDEYPTNYMRNLAIKQVKTEHMVLLDADFVPCPDFESRWFQSMRRVKHKNPKIAYVVPVFEGAKEITAADLPRTKSELKKIVSAENPVIYPFAHYSSPLSHELTNYTKWYTSFKPYKLKGYEDVYEPYLVLNTKVTDMPLFDIRFSGYGFNKIQHTMELMYNDYTLEVLPNVWATHVYHRISQFKKQFLNGPLTRLENRIKRYEYVSEIMRKYRIGPCSNAKS